MARRVRRLAIFSALAMAGCGRFGLDLLDLSQLLHDGGVDDASDAGARLNDYDSGVPIADGGRVSTPPSDAAVDAQVPAMSCSMTGTFAVKIAIALSWPAGLVNSGAGTSNIWARFVGTQSGNTLSGAIEPCGFVLPDFSLNPLVGTEKYQLDFPDTLFDHVPAYIPTTALTITSGSGFALNQPFSFPNIAILVGASLANPATDPWPAASVLNAPDLDADGKPGVTGLYSSAAGYTLPRANATGSQRSDRAYAGARFVLSASGDLGSCSDFSATGAFSNFDTHIVGCRIVGGADCTTTQRDTIDNGRPAFAPTSSTLHIVKVAAGTTCAQVRAMVP